MNEDSPREKDTLEILLISSVGMLAILDVFVFFHSLRAGASYQDIPFAVFSALPVFFLLLYVLSYRGFHKLASYLLIATYLISNSYAAYRYGAGMQVTLIAYALIIVMATILRGTRFGFFITGGIAAFIIPLWYAQLNGIITTRTQHPTGDDAIIFSIFYLLIMIVAWLYNREIERSLWRAIRSERALKEERDLLEIRVAERTDELQRTQLEKMQQLNRLAELGQLSSGLFHDLLNLLNTLSLRMDDETDPSLANAFNTTKQIENFTQAVRKQIGDAGGQTSFSLIKGIDHVIQLVHYKADKENVRIVFLNDSDRDIVHFGIPFKFQEVVINLLLNAIESYENIPRNNVRNRIIEISIDKTNGAATLHIRDNGCGMTPEILARIFELFFTTKDASKGIGIGLATTKKIIEEDLAGTITVQSEPGRGSLFTVTFPIKNEGDTY